MRYVFIILIGLLVGCSADPFVRPPLPKLVRPDALAIKTDFANAQAAEFSSQDSVIISAPFHDDIAVLGVVKIDRKADEFEMVGLNQLGLELFHLSGKGNTVTVVSAIPPLMEQKPILESIGRDVRRMYFDLVPPAKADYKIDDTTVRYEKGDLVYEFGGQPIVLLEKRVEGAFGPKWRVRYYDYAESAGRLYPRGIVMDNGHYHYRIVVKNRNWQTD